jgi:hypothetical protein
MMKEMIISFKELHPQEPEHCRAVLIAMKGPRKVSETLAPSELDSLYFRMKC